MKADFKSKYVNRYYKATFGIFNISHLRPGSCVINKRFQRICFAFYFDQADISGFPLGYSSCLRKLFINQFITITLFLSFLVAFSFLSKFSRRRGDRMIKLIRLIKYRLPC